jgi:hypothetical protein
VGRDVERRSLQVVRRATDAEKVLEFRIKNPRVTEDGDYYYDVHGIDPLQPTFFLMVSINAKGFSSGESNLMELGSDSFCEIFDVDDNGKVDATDALAVARKALGLKHGHVSVKGSIILAFQILKMAATLQCR